MEHVVSFTKERKVKMTHLIRKIGFWEKPNLVSIWDWVSTWTAWTTQMDIT